MRNALDIVAIVHDSDELKKKTHEQDMHVGSFVSIAENLACFDLNTCLEMQRIFELENVFYKFAKMYGYDYAPCFNKNGGWVRFYNSPIYASFDCKVTFTNEHDIFNQLEKAFERR